MAKDHKTPGSLRPADDGHGRGVRADQGVKVTSLPRVPPSSVNVGIGGKNRGPDRDVVANNVASQAFGRGLPANVNR